jgi:hypothetical protein
MNKERYKQIVNEVYENYINKLIFNEKDCHVDDLINQPNKTFIPYNQEEFINKIKTDKLFSERWGLKIEERGLRKDERHKLLTQQMSKLRAIRDEDYIEYNIPTKLITVTYNNETIEIYDNN